MHEENVERERRERELSRHMGWVNALGKWEQMNLKNFSTVNKPEET